MNGKKLLNETANKMEGLSFPGNKADFVKNLYLGKYDGSPASNLEAFQVFYLTCEGSICSNQNRKYQTGHLTISLCAKSVFKTLI